MTERLLHVYVDETQFQGHTGVAFLASEVKISSELIEEAMRALRDKTLLLENPVDQRTIDRGYFHASKDSVQARECLANSIKKHFQGTLFYAYVKKCNDSQQSQNEHIRIVTSIAYLGVMQSPKKIEFLFDKRKGFNEIVYRNDVNILYSNIDKIFYDYPLIKGYYPDIRFTCISPKEPGHQVVDLPLWGLNQSIFEKESEILDLSGACGFSKFETPQQEMEPKHGEYNFNQKGMNASVIEDTPHNVTLNLDLTPQVMTNAYVNVERIIHELATYEEEPNSGGSIISEAKRISQRLSNYEQGRKKTKQVQPTPLQEAAIYFIRNFEMIHPYINSGKDYTFLLETRRSMSLMFSTHLQEGVRMFTHIHRSRSALVNKDPSRLGLQRGSSLSPTE